MDTIFEPEPGHVLVVLDTGGVPGLTTTQETYQKGKIIKINESDLPSTLLGRVGHWAKYKDEVHLDVPGGAKLSFIKIADILGTSYEGMED
jgi:hypothetical protein